MADYAIQRGDNLTRIARAHCTDVKTLMELNPKIKNPNCIFANDTIKTPDSKTDRYEGSTPVEGGAPEVAAPKAEEKAYTETYVADEQPQFTCPQDCPAQDRTNPFWYAAGGAAAGVVTMRLAEKYAPAAKKGAAAAATATKKGLTDAGKFVADKTSKAATATGAYSSKIAQKVKDLSAAGKLKFVNAKEALKGKVSSAKVASVKASKSAGAAVKTAALKTGSKIKSGAKTVGNAAAKTGKKALAATGKAAPTVMKVVGKVAKPLAIAYSAVEIADAYKTGGTEAAVKKTATTASAVGGAWAGAKVGAMAGAAIGSAIPVVGTAAGALIGGILGSIGGWFAGETVSEKVLA